MKCKDGGECGIGGYCDDCTAGSDVPASEAGDKNALLDCPCGQAPTDLHIVEGSTSKWAWVCGDCCGEWHIEFRTKYFDLNSPECLDLAIDAWNEARRAI